MRLAFTIAVLLFAFRALGAEERPASAPPVAPASALPPLATPTWSLGAGLSFFAPVSSVGLLGGTGAGGSLGTLATIPVTPSVSVERVFSPQFALGLGLEGSIQYVSSGSQTTSNAPAGSIGVGLSPRFTMTGPDAPVSFALFATLFGGYNSIEGSGMPSSPPVLSSNALAIGVGGGVAFELRLLERLAVRVQASLVRLSLSSFTTRISMLAPQNQFNETVVGGSFIPSPSLELRLFL